MTVNKWLSVVYELSGCGFQFRCCDLDINIEIKVENIPFRDREDDDWLQYRVQYFGTCSSKSKFLIYIMLCYYNERQVESI